MRILPFLLIASVTVVAVTASLALGYRLRDLLSILIVVALIAGLTKLRGLTRDQEEPPDRDTVHEHIIREAFTPDDVSLEKAAAQVGVLQESKLVFLKELVASWIRAASSGPSYADPLEVEFAISIVAFQLRQDRCRLAEKFRNEWAELRKAHGHDVISRLEHHRYVASVMRNPGLL